MVMRSECTLFILCGGSVSDNNNKKRSQVSHSSFSNSTPPPTLATLISHIVE